MDSIVVVAGAVLVCVGVVLFLTGIFYLSPELSIRFERRWGGLGSSQGGWEFVVSDASAVANILFGVVLSLSGVGLLWPREAPEDPAPVAADDGESGSEPAPAETQPSSVGTAPTVTQPPETQPPAVVQPDDIGRSPPPGRVTAPTTESAVESPAAQPPADRAADYDAGQQDPG